MLSQEPFTTARIFEGGYGRLDGAFYVERSARRGWHSAVITVAGAGKIRFEDESEAILKPGSIFISHANGQGHREQAYGDGLWEMIWFSARLDSPTIIPAAHDFQIVEGISAASLKKTLFAIFDEVHYSDGESPRRSRRTRKFSSSISSGSWVGRKISKTEKSERASPISGKKFRGSPPAPRPFPIYAPTST